MENLNPDKAKMLDNLANLYYSQERYSEAEPLCQEVLSILRQQLGDTHPTVAKKFNDLAYLIYKQNRFNEAELLYLQSLQIYLQQQEDSYLGDFLVMLDNLSTLYHKQGRFAEEEAIYLQVFTSMKERFSTHPYFQTIDSMFILLLINLLQTGQVIQLSDQPITQSGLQRSLELLQQQLGEKHIAFATSLNNAAEFYRIKKRYSQAEPLYIQALTIIEDQLGQGHPTFQSAWQNLLLFLLEVVRANQVEDLSQHPVTQMLLSTVLRYG